MNRSIVNFNVPEWTLSALINGDYSGLNDEDEEKVKNFVSQCMARYGSAMFTVDMDKDQLGFLYRNDIDTLGADCYKITLPFDLNFKPVETTEPGAWYGIDKSLEISLMEYQLLVRKTIDTVENTEFQIIYRVGPQCYFVTTMDKADIAGLINESWFEKESFFSFVGENEAQFLAGNMATQLQSLLQYYGPENILGSMYHFSKLDEINSNYGFNFDGE